MGTILGIDPGGVGGHTGIVLLDVPDNAPATLTKSWAVPNDFDGYMHWHRAWGPTYADVDVVVCEHFVNRNIKGADLTPCFIEGAVRALWPNVVLQPASGKNSSVPDAVLKRLGLYDFPKDHHNDQREAGRHAVWYLKKQHHMPTLLAGWPKP